MSRPQPALRLTLILVLVAVMALLVVLPATASARTLGKGQATIRLDPVFALFVAGGFPPYPVPPGTMDFGVAVTPKLALPVVGGNWSSLDSRGTFLLRGGIDYIHYTAGPLTLHQLRVVKWHAGVNTTAGWTAQTNGTRIKVFDEDLTGSNPSFFKKGGHRYVKVNDVVLTYSTAFVTAFTNTFGPTPPGIPFGTATLVARLK